MNPFPQLGPHKMDYPVQIPVLFFRIHQSMKYPPLARHFAQRANLQQVLMCMILVTRTTGENLLQAQIVATQNQAKMSAAAFKDFLVVALMGRMRLLNIVAVKTPMSIFKHFHILRRCEVETTQRAQSLCRILPGIAAFHRNLQDREPPSLLATSHHGCTKHTGYVLRCLYILFQNISNAVYSF